MGSSDSANDEWLELHNPGAEPVNLQGWTLTDNGDLRISLSGWVPPYGFYLLERTDDQAVANIAADQIYTGGMNNSGETIWLLDLNGMVIDSANADGSSWPAGHETAHRSMERRGGDDRSGNWGTFPGYGGVGRDADGNAIGGTPRQPNAIDLPTPAPTYVPSRVVINEVLIRPHYDWEGAGGVSPDDEFIEPDQVLQLGVPPVRVDIMTSIAGISWDEAWAGKAPGDCGGVPVHYLGREQFIANKRAAGRAKDIADIEALGESG